MKDLYIYALFVAIIMALIFVRPESKLIDVKISALEAQLNTIQLVLMRNTVDNRPYHLIPNKRLKEK